MGGCVPRSGKQNRTQLPAAAVPCMLHVGWLSSAIGCPVLWLLSILLPSPPYTLTPFSPHPSHPTMQEDKDTFCNAVRGEVKATGLLDTVDNCWDFFINKVTACEGNGANPHLGSYHGKGAEPLPP